MNQGKHSSGDLQSRLKTRKILGVGETNNGDIHRSKISQVLGHNEHLYVKLPKYFSLWHSLLAILYTVCGLANLLISPTKPESFIEDEAILSQMEQYGKLYGCVLLGLAVLLWALWDKLDKSLSRTLMAAIAATEILQAGVLITSAWNSEIWSMKRKWHLFVSIVIAVICTYFIWAIGSSTAGLRKAPSYKDLRDQQTDDAISGEHSSPSAKENKKTD